MPLRGPERLKLRTANHVGRLVSAREKEIVTRLPPSASGQMRRIGGRHLRRSLSTRRCFRGHLRQSEVENFGVSAPRDKDVGRFDIAVDDALVVGVVEPRGRLPQHAEDAPRRQRVLGRQQMLQR